MTKLLRFSVLLVLLLIGAPARAQDADISPADWQAVISGQITAFRNHDAPAALHFAGAGFQERFDDPTAFIVAILASGYAPIVESRSHSFGSYKLLSPDQVLQEVRFVDSKQGLYQAVYQLMREPAGWRIQGVQLVKTPGIGV